MVLLKEYIIPLPLSVDEYRVGQLWADNETRTREGNSELLLSESCMYDGENAEYKKIVVRNDARVPSFVRHLAPAGSLDVHQEVWDSYPKFKVLIKSGYPNKRFHISMKMICVPEDSGSKENIHNEPDYDKIEKVVIDIANDPVNKDKPEYDPQTFHSKKTGRGNLGLDWISESKSEQPIMCCYVLAEVKLQIPGLQGKLENMIQSSVRSILTDQNREIFCGIDNWYGLEISDIPKIGS